MHLPRLTLEPLEARALLAGNIFFVNGVISIVGTDGPDTATVTHLPNSRSFTDDQVRVRLAHNGHVHESVFNLTRGSTIDTLQQNVVRINFDGEGGNDSFTNTSRVPADADGGSGRDTLTGGDGRDTLTGGTGNDRLSGRADNDVLFGGDDRDTLFGGAGHDELDGEDDGDRLEGGDGDDRLRGEGGPDTLLGGIGADALYGGSASDSLLGGAGGDGLFGGSGLDTVAGGTGADRVLSWKNASGTFGKYDPDVVVGLTSGDARVWFEDGQAKTHNGTTYAARAWSHSDIMRLDAALGVMHKETGDTKLLKTSWGFDVTFARYGGQGRGYNSGGFISLTDMQFDGDDTWLRGYVLHEVGHNWDEENPNWGTFKVLSGWTESWWNPDPDLYDRAEDGSNWYHLETADFASDYAENNPKDDFCESFAALFMQRAGWAWYNDGGGAAAIPDKIDVIADWVDSL